MKGDVEGEWGGGLADLISPQHPLPVSAELTTTTTTVHTHRQGIAPLTPDAGGDDWWSC